MEAWLIWVIIPLGIAILFVIIYYSVLNAKRNTFRKKARRIKVGMTLAEANAVMGIQGRYVNRHTRKTDFEYYKWECRVGELGPRRWYHGSQIRISLKVLDVTVKLNNHTIRQIYTNY